jgi:hypothetical protein
MLLWRIFLSNFQATFASGFPERSIPATETIGIIVEKFEHERYLFIHPVVLYDFV